MKWYLLSLKLLAIVVFIIIAQQGRDDSTTQVADPTLTADWRQFKRQYNIAHFGEDGYFVRAVQHGHALINQTYRYAWRFTRKSADDDNHACSHCHSPEDLAHAFVNSDRFDPTLGKRISFEERVMRCYAKHMDGFIPTIYDPAIRDIRIYARAVAHHLQLSEGTLATGAQ